MFNGQLPNLTKNTAIIVGVKGVVDNLDIKIKAHVKKKYTFHTKEYLAIGNLDGLVENCTLQNYITSINTRAHKSCGGIYNQNGTVQNCDINGFIANKGGGIDNLNGTVQNCTIQNCKTTPTLGNKGGGIYNINGTVQNCTIQNCKTIPALDSEGGGIFNLNGTIQNCTIQNCYAHKGGGILSIGGKIIYKGASTYSIKDCYSFFLKTRHTYDNGMGGGIGLTDGATLEMENSAILNIKDNTSTIGGGIYNIHSTIKASSNFTGSLNIYSNLSYKAGSGVYNNGIFTNESNEGSFTVSGNDIDRSGYYMLRVGTTENYHTQQLGGAIFNSGILCGVVVRDCKIIN